MVRRYQPVFEKARFAEQTWPYRLFRAVQWKAMMVELVIVIDPDVMNGTPCFRGTRVPFKNLIDYLEGGHSLGEFLRQFPTVTRDMAVQALEEAKDSLLARIA